LRNKILYDLCKNCNKKNCDHTLTEVDACKKSICENKGNKRNWPEEFHKRQLAFFNAIPEEGTISEYDHILKPKQIKFLSVVYSQKFVGLIYVISCELASP